MSDGDIFVSTSSLIDKIYFLTSCYRKGSDLTLDGFHINQFDVDNDVELLSMLKIVSNGGLLSMLKIVSNGGLLTLMSNNNNNNNNDLVITIPNPCAPCTIAYEHLKILLSEDRI